MKGFDEYKVSIDGQPVLKVSVHEKASPQQRLKWLLEMAAMWIFHEGQDLGAAIDHLTQEYEQIASDERESRRASAALRLVRKGE